MRFCVKEFKTMYAVNCTHLQSSCLVKPLDLLVHLVVEILRSRILFVKGTVSVISSELPFIDRYV